jgi:Transcriptional regulatory protein, C terminal
VETPAGIVYRFGPFEVDTAAGELLKQGKRISLQEQPFRLLVVLLESPGEVVTKAEIQRRIWENNTFVDFDSSLRVAVGKLRTEITGFYIDSSDAYHGFLRESDGTITTIDAPGRGTGAFQGTFAGSINEEGTITGYLVDSNNIYHGFLRTREGKLTTFHDSDGGTAAGQGTAAFSINPFGAITGALIDANNVLHGYSRSRRVTGWWVDGAGLNHGFVWYSDEQHSCEGVVGQDQ